MEYQEKLIILPTVQDMKEPLNITAYEAVGTGLAYNAIGSDPSMGWVITHLASKKVLCNPVGTEYEVKLLVEKVAGITDWNQTEEEIATQKIGAKFRECQQTVKSELGMQLETAMHTCMPDYLIETVMNDIEDDILRTTLLYAFKIVPSNVD